MKDKTWFFQKWFECWRHVAIFLFYTSGKACQCPLYKCLYFCSLLVFSCCSFLPGYLLLNHFSLPPSVVCIMCILFFGYFSCIHLLCLRIRFHLLICNPSFLVYYSLSFLRVPAISSALATVCISLTHPHLTFMLSLGFSLLIFPLIICIVNTPV